jgi:hypothetical protein
LQCNIDHGGHRKTAFRAQAHVVSPLNIKNDVMAPTIKKFLVRVNSYLKQFHFEKRDQSSPFKISWPRLLTGENLP